MPSPSSARTPDPSASSFTATSGVRSRIATPCRRGERDEGGVEVGAADDHRVVPGRGREREVHRPAARRDEHGLVDGGDRAVEVGEREPERLERPQRGRGEAVAARLVPPEAALSTTSTSRPRSRAVMPAAVPAGPAPTTSTSTSRSVTGPTVIRDRVAIPTTPFRHPTRIRVRIPAAGNPCTPFGRRSVDPQHASRTVSARSDPGSTMNVLVCVKQIPDPATPGELTAEHTLKREGKLILDESDSFGVEMALQLVDKAGGGEVTLVSIAPHDEVSGLRTALAMGAAKAVLVSDPSLAGSDSLSTAKVIAKAVERVGDVDLLLTATESTDGYTGTIPGQVAELLDWPSLTFAKEVTIADGTVTIQRQTEAGYDVVEASLPAVVSVTAGVVEPRYPSFKGIMAAKNKPVDAVKPADLGLADDQVGWAGARQEITSVEQAPERQAGEKIEDDGTAFEAVVAYLEKLKVV